MKKVILILLASMSMQTVAMEPAPYAGQQNRSIKALSVSEIEGLKGGMGMGLAKAAELNHFPGPRHVLDDARKLDLTNDQLDKTKKIFKLMKKEAIVIGKKIITEEKFLDNMFAGGKLSAADLQKKLDEISKYRAQLRFVHLKAHLEQKKILSSRQVKHYDMLRGYSGNSSNHKNHNGHH